MNSHVVPVTVASPTNVPLLPTSFQMATFSPLVNAATNVPRKVTVLSPVVAPLPSNNGVEPMVLSSAAMIVILSAARQVTVELAVLLKPDTDSVAVIVVSAVKVKTSAVPLLAAFMTKGVVSDGFVIVDLLIDVSASSSAVVLPDKLVVDIYTLALAMRLAQAVRAVTST